MTPDKTKLVGILNLTPDSFSDGGRYESADAAVVAAQRMIEAGAHIVDIGAESTRPGATPVAPEEEWRRLEPVLAKLKRLPSIPFSIDTRHAGTAKKALAHGARWINDVSGFCDPEMVRAVAPTDCKLVMMHSLTVPADKNIVMQEDDVVAALIEFARHRIAGLEAAGIDRARIIFDPGLGFGKSVEQSHSIVNNIRRFETLDVPLLVGHSRKNFLTVGGAADRDETTLFMSYALARQDVDYLRVHDVARHARLLAHEEKTAAHA